MTAEIAILNKYAVALAADSAVTISADSKEQKIFDSGDKWVKRKHYFSAELNPRYFERVKEREGFMEGKPCRH